VGFCSCGNLRICFCEYADDANGDIVVNKHFVVFAYDVDTEFLVEGGVGMGRRGYSPHLHWKIKGQGR
jgi:hypothetical protein